VSILDASISEHDLYFLNFGARNFLEKSSESISINYEKYRNYIIELVGLLSSDERKKLSDDLIKLLAIKSET